MSNHDIAITNEDSIIAGKYLTFRLSNEDYGLEILKVQEIIKKLEITAVPRTPSFVKGVINLRGQVIPVIDLRLKFNMEEKEETQTTCIIVVQVFHNDSEVIMGIIVDEVSEVMDIPANAIEPAPSFGASVCTSFILGMAKTKDTVKILLDIDKVLNDQDLQKISEINSNE